MNSPDPQPSKRLPADVVKLGFVSRLTDLSSEMIFSVFAVFFTSVVGASTPSASSLRHWWACWGTASAAAPS